MNKPKTTPAAQYDASTQAAQAAQSGADGAKWITLGGGSPVAVDPNGQILAGCPGLKGHDLDELDETREFREDKQQAAEAQGVDGYDLDADEVNAFDGDWDHVTKEGALGVDPRELGYNEAIPDDLTREDEPEQAQPDASVTLEDRFAGAQDLMGDMPDSPMKTMFADMQKLGTTRSHGVAIDRDIHPEYASRVLDWMQANARNGDGFGDIYDMSNHLGAGAIGYHSPAGMVVLVPPRTKDGDWEARYALPDSVPTPQPSASMDWEGDRRRSTGELSQIMVESGITSDYDKQAFLDAVHTVHQQMTEPERERAETIRSLVGSFVGGKPQGISGFTRILKNATDYDQIKHFDELVDVAERNFPWIFGTQQGGEMYGATQDKEQALWDYLRDGITTPRTPYHDERVVTQAFDLLQRQGWEAGQGHMPQGEGEDWDFVGSFARNRWTHRAYRYGTARGLVFHYSRDKQLLLFDWNEDDHPRAPAGDSEGRGGQFVSKDSGTVATDAEIESDDIPEDTEPTDDQTPFQQVEAIREAWFEWSSAQSDAFDPDSDVTADDLPPAPDEYAIPGMNMERLQTKLDKLNKRAAKLGLDPVVFDFEEIGYASEWTNDVESVWVLDGDPRADTLAKKANWQETGKVMPYFRLTLPEQRMKLDGGWEFLGTLTKVPQEDGPDKNLVKTIPGAEVPADVRDKVGTCDHCKKKRRRKDTYILQDENGETKVCGKECMKDFTGHDPNQLARAAEWIQDLRAEIQSEGDYDEERGSAYAGVVPFGRFTEVAAAVIRRDGWKSKAQYGDESTAGTIDYLTNPPDKRASENAKKAWRSAVAQYQPTPEDEEQAQKAIDWIRDASEATDASDFIYNLGVIAGAGHVTGKTVGFAAALIPAWARATDFDLSTGRTKEQKAEGLNEHFGESGKRYDLELTVDRVRELENFYGTTYQHVLRDQDGRTFVWWASTGSQGLEQGRTYNVKATVKKHDDYRGQAQTVLSRVNLKAEKGQSKTPTVTLADVENSQSFKSLPGTSAQWLTVAEHLRGMLMDNPPPGDQDNLERWNDYVSSAFDSYTAPGLHTKAKMGQNKAFQMMEILRYAIFDRTRAEIGEEAEYASNPAYDQAGEKAAQIATSVFKGERPEKYERAAQSLVESFQYVRQLATPLHPMDTDAERYAREAQGLLFGNDMFGDQGTAAAEWREEDHPRDERGRFTDRPSPFMALPKLRDELTGRDFDRPAIYLTGHSSETTRKAAKDRGDTLGVLITPETRQYIDHLDDYDFCGVDNGCYSRGGEFDGDEFLDMLQEIKDKGHADKVMFAAAPDVFDPTKGVGDPVATLERSRPFFQKIRDLGFPVALVGQDGIEDHPEDIPWDEFDVLFLGGSTAWKQGTNPIEGNPLRVSDKQHREAGVNRNFAKMIREAHKRGKHIHMGRVNSAKRQWLAAYGLGAQSVDGTFVAQGPDKNLPQLLDWIDTFDPRKENADRKYPGTLQKDEDKAIHEGNDPVAYARRIMHLCQYSRQGVQGMLFGNDLFGDQGTEAEKTGKPSGWDESKHPRVASGSAEGGQFTAGDGGTPIEEKPGPEYPRHDGGDDNAHQGRGDEFDFGPLDEPEPEAEPEAEASTSWEAPETWDTESALPIANQARRGEFDIEQHKASFAHHMDSREEFIAAAKKRFKAKDLKNVLGNWGDWNADRRKYAENLQALHDAVGRFWAINGVENASVSMDQLGRIREIERENMIRAVDELTQEDIDLRRNNVASAKAARQEREEASEKADRDPETLEEFRDAAKRKQYLDFTPEQRKAWDELEADAAREARKADTPEVLEAVGGDVGAELTKNFHSKRGVDIFTVSPTRRVDRDEFLDLKRKAKTLGGWYYKAFKGTPGGFHFENEEDAQKMMALFGGESVDVADKAEERAQAKADKRTAKLRGASESLREKGQEALAADRQTNTARRAAMAASAEGQARKQIAKAQTMDNIADAIEAGEAKHLERIHAGTHIDALENALSRASDNRRRHVVKTEHNGNEPWGHYDEWKSKPYEEADADHAEYPMPFARRETMRELMDATKGRQGIRADRARVQSLLDRAIANDGYTRATAEEWESVQALIAKAGKAKDANKWMLQTLGESASDYKRLKAAGINDIHQLRAALREFIPLRGKKGAADPVKKAERDLIGKKLPGFFPTPPSVSDLMLERAGIEDGHTVLEPSAGKGDLLDAIQAAHPGASLHGIEFNRTLEDVLTAKGHSVEFGDFMDHRGTYDRIVMNPPFENRQDVAHVQHAFDRLAPGGRLVAVMGAGAFGGSRKADQEFRDWLDSHGADYEPLPDGSFSGSDAFRQTGVSTYLVTIDKGENTPAQYDRRSASDWRRTWAAAREQGRGGQETAEEFASELWDSEVAYRYARGIQGQLFGTGDLFGDENTAAAGKGWDESKHPRESGGKATGGQFTKGGSGGGAPPRQSAEREASPEVDHAADYKQNGTRSAAFKAWFGDWEADPASASKVVNDEGEPEEQHEVQEPVKMYHGTGQGGWDTFEPRWGQATTSGKTGEELLYGPGYYFTNDRGIAEEYSRIGSKEKFSTTANAATIADQMRKAADALDAEYREWEAAGMAADGTHVQRAAERAREIQGLLESTKRLPDPDSGAYTDMMRAVYMTTMIANDAAVESEAAGRGGTRIDNYVEKTNTSEVKEVYLNIRKPWDISDGTLDEAGAAEFVSNWESIDWDGAPAPVGENEVATWGEYKAAFPEATEGADWMVGNARRVKQFIAGWVRDAGGCPHHSLYSYMDTSFGKTIANWALGQLGYDGITHEGGQVTGGRSHRVWIAFEPNQVKSVNNAGTFDPNNPSMQYARGTQGQLFGTGDLFGDQGTPQDGKWDESKHPRDEKGQFTEGSSFYVHKGVSNAGVTHETPVKIHDIGEDGSFGLGYDYDESNRLQREKNPDHKDFSPSNPVFNRIPADTARHFINDMQGRVEGTPDHEDDRINAIVSGKAPLIAKGNDGMAFDVGDSVVKVSTSVPYHWTNGHHTPEQARKRLRDQVALNQQMIADGVPGLLDQSYTEHAGKGFAAMDKLDVPPTTEQRSLTQKLDPSQLEQVKNTLGEMHARGYALGDAIQVGIDSNGDVRIFDTGAAEANASPDLIAEDRRQFRNLQEANGQEPTFWPEEASEKFNSILARGVAMMERGTWPPSFPKRLAESFEMLAKVDPAQADWQRDEVNFVLQGLKSPIQYAKGTQGQLFGTGDLFGDENTEVGRQGGWKEDDHPRVAAGDSKGGQFTSNPGAGGGESEDPVAAGEAPGDLEEFGWGWDESEFDDQYESFDGEDMDAGSYDGVTEVPTFSHYKEAEAWIVANGLAKEANLKGRPPEFCNELAKAAAKMSQYGIELAYLGNSGGSWKGGKCTAAWMGFQMSSRHGIVFNAGKESKAILAGSMVASDRSARHRERRIEEIKKRLTFADSAWRKRSLEEEIGDLEAIKRWTVDEQAKSSPAQVIAMHEYGHAFYYTHNVSDTRTIAKEWNSLTKDIPRRDKLRVSEYAASSGAELWAETWALVHDDRGDEVPESIMEAFKSIMDRAKRNAGGLVAHP